MIRIKEGGGEGEGGGGRGAVAQRARQGERSQVGKYHRAWPRVKWHLLLAKTLNFDRLEGTDRPVNSIRREINVFLTWQSSFAVCESDLDSSPR